MKIVVGLSGGVDSSVAAYLLKEQGHEVIGVFMRNWNDASVTLEDECPWVEDSNDALLVAQKLGIPFQVIDMSELYKERIVDYMFAEYEKGRTPNPDILCNREVKFEVFLETALQLGAEKVATGHYARVSKDEKGFHLWEGKDAHKDQSYFLCQLNQYQLSKALFPIGELEKSEVRTIAKEQELVTAEKKDSQGLCFIGKVKLPDFLQQQLKPKEGKIIEIFSDYAPYKDQNFQGEDTEENWEKWSAEYQYQDWNGKEVGKHQGAHYFTVGQRKGLGVGGHKEPLFVLETQTDKNLIFVGEGADHPGLYKKALFIENAEIHWVNTLNKLSIGDSLEVEARFRYRQELVSAVLHQVKEGMYMVFKEPQKAITKGQFAAWYQKGEVLGSGVIS